jgi:pimeloyl-ACP methyl ester carboxylesterase
MLTTTSADGTTVRAYDDGRGPAIVLLGPGLDDGTRDKKLAKILAKRFRVVRLHRRQYRLDLKADPKLGSPCTVADEVKDVLAVVRAIGEPGSSSTGTPTAAWSRWRPWQHRRPRSPAG